MIAVSDRLRLRKISHANQEELRELMTRIYLPVYQHLWADGGKWYIGKTYASDQLKKELAEPHTLYCFVQYQSETVGIIRLLENELVPKFENRKAAKLQRIYLDSAVRGKGIGKTLINWMENRVRQEGTAIFWLEVMDTQQNAINFYEKLGFQKFNKVQFESDLMHEHLSGMFQMWKTLD